MRTMRAKMYVSSVEHFVTSEILRLSCVTSSATPYGPKGENEDNTFARFTPSGTAEYQITNPDLIGQYTPGQTFYVDFTPVE